MDDWHAVEILGQWADGRLVLRETGRIWAGVWLADHSQVRIEGREFAPGAAA